MFDLVPEYYLNFKCVADKCLHTCCEGWQIQIDKAALRDYRKVKGDLGKRLKNNILHGKDGYYFKLDNGRCPLLDQDGLCDIILELGEDHLTEICKMHPRFLNYFENHIEIGLGMCCETAADLIINNSSDKLVLINNGSPCNIEAEKFYSNYIGWEKELLEKRSELFAIITDQHIGYDEMRSKLLQACGILHYDYDFLSMANFLLKLEIMQTEWRTLVEKAHRPCCGGTYDIAVSLTLYFVFRYIAQAKNHNDLKKYMFFSIISVDTICHIIKALDFTAKEDILSVCRMYSQEIEYSTQNVKLIIDEFYNCEN